MFDTMTMTKILGGFCGAFLIFLLGGFFSEFIYHEADHGDDHHQAYTIDTGDDGHGEAEETVEVPFAEVFALADAASGEKVFRQCKACHSIDPGKNGTGPTLFGIVGRAAEASDGFSYSGALKAVVTDWTPEALSDFIANPKSFAPGTKMTYKGLKDVADRANLIAWLSSLGG